MLTTKLFGLHTKCASILSMIQTVNERIIAQRAKLRQYDNEGDVFHVIKLTNLRCDIIRTLDHDKKVKDRLVIYYANNHMLLMQDALKRCSRYFDFIPA